MRSVSSRQAPHRRRQIKVSRDPKGSAISSSASRITARSSRLPAVRILFRFRPVDLRPGRRTPEVQSTCAVQRADDVSIVFGASAAFRSDDPGRQIPQHQCSGLLASAGRPCATRTLFRLASVVCTDGSLIGSASFRLARTCRYSVSASASLPSCSSTWPR